MDFAKRRTELLAEYEQMQQQAAGFAERAAACRERCAFLRGAIALINDEIGAPAPDPAVVTPAKPPPAGPLSRAERRRLRKAGKGNGAPAAAG